MSLSTHAQLVNHYYDVHTDEFYLNGWDPEHIHFGIFDQGKDEEYDKDPMTALADRRDAVLRMTQTIVGSANIKDGETVVDAGCGVGGTALFVAAAHDVSVTGLNINDKQLEIARERAAAASLGGRVAFQFCDCSQQLPFPDQSVDVIINIETACHYADRKRFISEAARVLRPKGRLVGQDWIAADGLSAAETLEHVKPLSDAWYLSDIDSLASYRTTMAAAGFNITYARHIEQGIMPNGYIMRMGYQDVTARAAQRPLTAYEEGNRERFRTLSHALIAGYMKVGHYVAEKP